MYGMYIRARPHDTSILALYIGVCPLRAVQEWQPQKSVECKNSDDWSSLSLPVTSNLQVHRLVPSVQESGFAVPPTTDTRLRLKRTFKRIISLAIEVLPVTCDDL